MENSSTFASFPCGGISRQLSVFEQKRSAFIESVFPGLHLEILNFEFELNF